MKSLLFACLGSGPVWGPRAHGGPSRVSGKMVRCPWGRSCPFVGQSLLRNAVGKFPHWGKLSPKFLRLQVDLGVLKAFEKYLFMGMYFIYRCQQSNQRKSGSWKSRDLAWTGNVPTCLGTRCF